MLTEQVEIHLYKKRWVVIALALCLFFMMVFTYSNFGIVNNVIAAYFNTSYASVDWAVLGYNLGSFFTAPVMALLALKKVISCKKYMIIGSLMQGANYVFLIVGFSQPNFFAFVVLGQILGGISATVLWTVPALLAQIWFPETQIGLAIGIVMIGCSAGAFTGYLLPTQLIESPKNGSKSMYEHLDYTNMDWFLNDRFVYQWLYLILLLLAFIVLLLLVIFVPEMPEKPPSMAQHLKRQSLYEEDTNKVTLRFFISTAKILLFDKIFVACATTATITFYSFVLCDLSVEAIVHQNFFVDISAEKLSGYLMMLVPIGSFIGNFIGGLLLDKFKKYSLQSTLGALTAFFSSIVLLLSVLCKVMITLFVSYFFLGLSIRITYISILDSIMQHTYPMEPVFIVSILTFFESILAVCVIEINRHIIYDAGLVPGIIFMCALLLLVTVLCIVFKPKTKRLSAEKSGEVFASEEISLLSQK